jgi:hypothetical protein
MARRPFWIAAVTALIFYFGVREFVPLVRSHVFAAQLAAQETMERIRGEPGDAPTHSPRPSSIAEVTAPAVAASFDIDQSLPVEDALISTPPALSSPPAPEVAAASPPKSPAAKVRRAPRRIAVVQAPAPAAATVEDGAAALGSVSAEMDSWIAGLADGDAPPPKAPSTTRSTTGEGRPAGATAETPAPL